MDNDLTEEIIKIAASPHLIASASKAHEILAELNSLISDLRLEVNELELVSDLHHNQLMQQEGKSIPLKESEYKISEPYKEWKKKSGTLTDLRAVRRNLDRHAELLSSQERFGRKTPSYVG